MHLPSLALPITAPCEGYHRIRTYDGQRSGPREPDGFQTAFLAFMAAIDLGAALAAEVETRSRAAVDAHLHGIAGHQTAAVIADIDLAGFREWFWIDEFNRRKIQAL